MKHNFLLDENMVMRALLGQSRVARDFWAAVWRNCHRIIVSSLLADKYWEKVRLAQRRKASEVVANAMVKTIHQLLHNPDKRIWVEPSGSISLSGLIRHLNDRFLADIAVAAVETAGADDCIVVTVDRSTRDDFNRPEFLPLGIQGSTIEQGLVFARDKNG